jgi:ABC-2 type transport system ATP-binding protein
VAATVETEGLRKRFGKVDAVCGVDLSVAEGTVLAMLGPNGAGKTTTVRILATLLEPDAGRATVAGFDVVRHSAQVRRRIGLTGQYAAVDARLTGRENLRLIGVLHGLRRRDAGVRAAELLEQFDLADAADRLVSTYSGGMRRRLDLAASLVARPLVVFLDEPTTGLDPVGRQLLWRTVRDLVAGGMTILLTTQYLEEADELADNVVVVDKGQVVAYGTSAELKSRVGGERLEIAPVALADVPAVVCALAGTTTSVPVVSGDQRSVSVPLHGGVSRLAAAATALRDAGVEVAEFAVRRPSLVDVFVSLTGGPR